MIVNSSNTCRLHKLDRKIKLLRCDKELFRAPQSFCFHSAETQLQLGGISYQNYHHSPSEPEKGEEEEEKEKEEEEEATTLQWHCKLNQIDFECRERHARLSGGRDVGQQDRLQFV